MEFLIVVAVALGIAFAPAPKPRETVVVLPSADGHIGKVVVERNGRQYLLDGPYAASRAEADGTVEVTRLSDQDVKQAFGPALQALPARPASFVLHFLTGTDELTADSKVELQKILAEIKQRPYPDILVIGHTDTVGERDANDALSAQRAERMKAYLVEIGVAPERVRVAGRGERELLVPTADNVDEPRNRRVEINVR